MTPQEIRDHLGRALGVELEWQEGPKDPFVVVPHERWLDACRALRGDDALGFEFLRSLCGVDRPKENCIEVVAHLFSYRRRHAMAVKTRVDRADPQLPSCGAIWPAAIWHERETYDLVGIRFPGNPDLRRILLPEDWVGHPLRKDYQLPPDYRGIPTKRNQQAAAPDAAAGQGGKEP